MIVLKPYLIEIFLKRIVIALFIESMIGMSICLRLRQDNLYQFNICFIFLNLCIVERKYK